MSEFTSLEIKLSKIVQLLNNDSYTAHKKDQLRDKVENTCGKGLTRILSYLNPTLKFVLSFNLYSANVSKMEHINEHIYRTANQMKKINKINNTLTNSSKYTSDEIQDTCCSLEQFEQCNAILSDIKNIFTDFL
ncbi:hypothetical protein A3Q56_02355 [Intoshia linei]|uniref:Uncharacterized protein n=1 Tax=Intoshia linei TaxID=1819745 RepID=A0A177B6Z9_9BILA|nr:hypothetical protein A3Q56_02355 [Intoshia linei]